MNNVDYETSRLENSARAAWLYFICGNTQEEIAREMNVSRPTVQRLIAFALSEHVITFRVGHPIAECVDWAIKLKKRFGLKYCDVVPTNPKDTNSVSGVAASAAAYIEEKLGAPSPIVMGLGTGRTLRAAVQQVRPMDCPRHTLVSLVSNVASDGSASSYDTLGRLADATGARAYPMFMPVLAASVEERRMLVSVQLVRRLHALAAGADVTIVGVGQMDFQAQQFIDGFITRDELIDLMRAGAVGEIVGWAYDGSGRVLDCSTNARITSVPHRPQEDRLVVGVGLGETKVRAIHSAIVGGLLTGLITDVLTARSLLEIA